MAHPMNPSPISAEPRQAAVFFILVTVALDMLSFGIIIPVLPRLVEEFLGGDTAQAAEIYGLMGTAWALMQFIGSPIQGRAVRSFRPAAGGAPLQLRPRSRFHSHGAGS